MPDLMNQTIDAASANAPQWLQERLSTGRAVWAQAELPTRKTEAWKYTSLHALIAVSTARSPALPARPSWV